MKHHFLHALALLPMLVCAVSDGARAEVTVFPPENATECTIDTALTWDGSGNVRCEPVSRPKSEQGSTVYVKQFAVLGEASYNELATDGIAKVFSMYGASGSAAELAEVSRCTITPADASNITALRSKMSNDSLCLNYTCFSLTGFIPNLTQFNGGCAKGDTAAYCQNNGGRDMRAIFSCFSADVTTVSLP